MNRGADSYGRTTTLVGAVVADLVHDPTLDTHVVAGGSGLDRPVLWAHTCELLDPQQWLGPHDLLMTMGGCVPTGSVAQRRLIAALDDAGLAGVTIGEPVTSPRYTKAMREEADRRGFPVLFTGPTTPFAAIGRAVAAATVDERSAEVLLLSRLYRRATTLDLEQRRRGEGLESILGTAVRVVDEATGGVVVGPPEAEDHDGWHRQPLHTRRPTHMRVRDRGRLDAFVLVHLTQMLEVDANAILDDAQREARHRSEVFAGWLDDRELDRTAAALDELWGVRRGPFRVVASTVADRESVHLRLALGDVPVLSLDDGDLDEGDRVLVACLDRDLDRVRELLEPHALGTGVSVPHRRPADAGAAVGEATAALRSASVGAAWQVFEDQRLSLLARSRREAQDLVDGVLGTLTGSDDRSTTLRETLFAFLDHDLRWKETADRLAIHRQTLVYRIRQIESATGRSVRTTGGIAELWLARTVWAQYETHRGP